MPLTSQVEVISLYIARWQVGKCTLLMLEQGNLQFSRHLLDYFRLRFDGIVLVTFPPDNSVIGDLDQL